MHNFFSKNSCQNDVYINTCAYTSLQNLHHGNHFPHISVRIRLNRFLSKCLVFLIKTRSLKKWNFVLIKQTKAARNCLWKIFDAQLLGNVNFSYWFFKFLPTRVSLVKIFRLLKKPLHHNYCNKFIVVFKKNNAKNMEIFWRW